MSSKGSRWLRFSQPVPWGLARLLVCACLTGTAAEGLRETADPGFCTMRQHDTVSYFIKVILFLEGTGIEPGFFQPLLPSLLALHSGSLIQLLLGRISEMWGNIHIDTGQCCKNYHRIVWELIYPHVWDLGSKSGDSNRWGISQALFCVTGFPAYAVFSTITSR